MKNAEWMIKNGNDLRDLDTIVICRDDSEKVIGIRFKCNMIDKITTDASTSDAVTILRWLSAEHVEPILDDVENRYLKGVIRPFRDRVQSISKEGNSIVEWLSFKLVNNAPFELPFFKSGRMYKNMERGKEYTLDELGL